jgi:hypothetical protein
VLLSLARKRRLYVLAAGYAVVAVFGLVAAIARWGFGVSGSSALAAGAIATIPLVVALLGERITGIKAFSVEVSLAQITVPVQVDLTHAVMAMAEMGPSGSPELLATFWGAIRSQARLLRLNLRNDDYWWSTRVYLTAALATDYTKVEQLVSSAARKNGSGSGCLIRRPRVPGSPRCSPNTNGITGLLARTRGT